MNKTNQVNLVSAFGQVVSVHHKRSMACSLNLSLPLRARVLNDHRFHAAMVESRLVSAWQAEEERQTTTERECAY